MVIGTMGAGAAGLETHIALTPMKLPEERLRHAVYRIRRHIHGTIGIIIDTIILPQGHIIIRTLPVWAGRGMTGKQTIVFRKLEHILVMRDTNRQEGRISQVRYGFWRQRRM